MASIAHTSRAFQSLNFAVALNSRFVLYFILELNPGSGTSALARISDAVSSALHSKWTIIKLSTVLTLFFQSEKAFTVRSFELSKQWTDYAGVLRSCVFDRVRDTEEPQKKLAVTSVYDFMSKQRLAKINGVNMNTHSMQTLQIFVTRRINSAFGGEHKLVAIRDHKLYVLWLIPTVRLWIDGHISQMGSSSEQVRASASKCSRE